MADTVCLCSKLRRAAQAVTGAYDQVLAPLGITVAQFALLRNIARLPEPHISGLAQAVGLDRSTLGRNLHLLARAGLVELESGNDRRARVVRLTAAGQTAIDAALPAWAAVQARFQAVLGEEKRRLLFELLSEIERGAV